MRTAEIQKVESRLLSVPSEVRADKQGRGQEHANSPKQYATKTKPSAKAKHVREWSHNRLTKSRLLDTTQG